MTVLIRRHAAIMVLIALSARVYAQSSSLPAWVFPPHKLPPDAILYEDAARTFHEIIAMRVWLGEAIIPRNELSSQRRDFGFSEGLGYQVHDCSDAKYRCIFSNHRVYAVPRARLSPRSMYAIGGAEFTVEDCLRGDEHICQVAVIRSDCQQFVDQDGCAMVPEGRGGSQDVGPTIYFIYNEDFGVTAFGSDPKSPSSASERFAIASQMVLQGRVGLLKK